MKKNSVRNNPNLKNYLQWLREKIAPYLVKDEVKRSRSLNADLTERDYLRFTGRIEKIFITDSEDYPIVKIIGRHACLRNIEETNVNLVVSLLDNSEPLKPGDDYFDDTASPQIAYEG